MLSLPHHDVTALLTEDEHMRVYRGIDRRTDAPVVLKMPAGTAPAAQARERLRNEYAVLRDIDCSAVPHPYDLLEHGQSLVLVCEDIGGRPLAAALPGLRGDLERFFAVALGLVDALESMHRLRMFHRDIRPQNIVVNPDTGRVQLIDFGKVSRLGREHVPPLPPDRIEGTLSYLAPEQTGRMNRTVDYRADFYSLGATLYELLAGQPPHVGEAAIDPVHGHVARAPRPLAELAEGVPEPLGDIVLKLLSKLAEDRYQSAAGLRADLETCRRHWRAERRVPPFPLGRDDVSDRLQLPQKLYGRERELAALAEAFAEVARGGRPRMVLVAGRSGIGKSALVAELHKPIVARHGHFIAGKFDQYRLGVPYATLAQALQSLVEQLLAAPADQVAGWRRALLAAVGDNGRLIVDLVPQAAQLIGPQPPVGELPPEQARRRAHRVFQRFFAAVARADRPLVLFLDDLQWVDAASLELLAQLCSHPETRHLLVLGAYRDNEVSAAHPLALMVEGLRREAVPVQTLTLPPLGQAQVLSIVADALQCAEAEAAPLAQRVHAKTRGNPFFCGQFVALLHQDGLLAFDRDARRWRWDVAEIDARNFSDDVVALLLGEMHRLPKATQQVLAIAGFLGNAFAASLLAPAMGRKADDVDAHLMPALQLGFVVRHGDHCRFLHDRVQEAAYLLTPRDERAALHARIGRLMLERAGEAALDEQVFDIVNHLNAGLEVITDSARRRQLAELNGRAAAKARAATSYADAAAYLAGAVALLPAQAWQDDHALAFRLHLAHADCEYLAGRLDEAERLLATVEREARSALDRGRCCMVRIRVHMTRCDHRGARAIAMHYLRELGVEQHALPGAADVEQAYAEVERLMAGRSIEALAELPAATDPRREMALQMMVSITTATYFNDPIVWALHVPTMMALSLEAGTTEASVMAYTFFGFELAGSRRRYHEGYRHCQMAFALMERLGERTRRGNLLAHWGFTAAWVRPLDEALRLVLDAVPACIENGDLLMASTASHHVVLDLLLAGAPLPAVCQAADTGLALAQQAQYPLMEVCLRPRRQFAQMLRGRTAGLADPSDESFDTAAFEARLGANALAMGACCYHVTRLVGHVFAGDAAAACASARHAAPLLPAVAATLEEYLHALFEALARAALHDRLPPADRPPALQLLRSIHQRLRAWGEINPGTFGSGLLLASAELGRIEGRDAEAIRHYEQAAALAREHGMSPLEALAHERAAGFYLRRGAGVPAEACLRAAHAAYGRWGAIAKQLQLERDFPALLMPRGEASPGPAMSIATLDAASPGAAASDVDAPAGALPAGRDTLPAQLLRAAMSCSGATSGRLLHEAGSRLLNEADGRRVHGADSRMVNEVGSRLVNETGSRLVHEAGSRLVLAAASELADDGASVHITLPGDTIASDGPPPAWPASLVAAARQRGEPLWLDDAAGAHAFDRDAYFGARRPRSVLALPLRHGGTTVGLLYLEHAAIGRAFTAVRRELLARWGIGAAPALARSRQDEALAEARATLEQQVAAAQSAWQCSDRLLRALVDHVPAPVAVTGRDGRCLLHNERYAQACSHPGEDLVGQEADRIDPEHAARRQARDRAVLDQNRALSFEEDEPAAEGSRHLRLEAFPVPDAGGQPYAVGSVAIDDTELRRAQSLAENALRAKSDALASVGHEIRTPINAILGMAHLALRSGLAPQQHGHVERIERSALSLLGLVNDILDFSNLEAGRLHIESTAFQLHEVMEQVAEAVRAPAESRGLELLLSMPARLPGLVGDPMRLGQVLTNLARNAVRFTAQGEVVVAAAVGQRHEASIELRFSVRDTGVGMDEAHRQRLFGPPGEASGVPARRYGDSGLGLAVARHLVQRMGGLLSVQSLPGAGSTFAFDLPFPVQSPQAAAAPRVEGALAGRRLLVVDDHAGSRRLLGAIAREFGLGVTLAPDGWAAQRAVALAARCGAAFDLALVDYRMPGLDGVECARRLAAREHGSRPIVLMSGAHERDELTQALRHHAVGAHGWLRKPVTPQALFDGMLAALAGSRQAPALPHAVALAGAADASAGASVQGARVLVVDDNPAHRQLAADLLEPAGVAVASVENGQQAIDALARERFDAVLMDGQMPVMDGFAAARAIRALPQWQSLPILDMTGDPDRALAAGMNEPVAKPLSAERLIATLARWVRPAGMRPVTAPPAAAGELPAALPGIDMAAGLAATAGNRMLQRRLLDMYASRLANVVGQLRDAQQRGDTATAHRLAHDLASTSGSLGAFRMAEAARALEAALAGNPSEDAIEPLLGMLATELGTVRAGLKAAGLGRGGLAGREPEKKPPA